MAEPLHTAIPRGQPAGPTCWTEPQLQQHGAAVRAVFLEELNREPDPEGLLAYVWRMGCYHETKEQIRASVQASPEYAALHPSVPPSPPVTQRGQLRIVTGGFADDTGPTLPVFCHAGDLFAAYTRTPEPALAQLDVVAAAGYRGIRFWTVLGGDYWTSKGRDISADTTPDYWAHLRTFLEALHARGLQNIISQGDVGQIRDRQGFMCQLGATVNAVGPEVAAIVDAGNEAWQTGEPDPVRLAEMGAWFRHVCPQPLLTLTSPPGETKAELDAYSLAPADLFDVHGYRGGRWYDKVRHIFSIGYEIKPRLRLGIQGEPTGPGELVSVTDNKDELDDNTLAALALMALMSRQAWVYMSGHGVVWRGPLESQPGFYAVPQAVAWLPTAITSWPTLMHGGERWAATRVFAATGEMRCDHALSADGRFACLIYGPGHARDLHPVRPVTIDLDQSFGPHIRLVIGRVV